MNRLDFEADAQQPLDSLLDHIFRCYLEEDRTSLLGEILSFGKASCLASSKFHQFQLIRLRLYFGMPKAMRLFRIQHR